jgi:hypothetical protein
VPAARDGFFGGSGAMAENHHPPVIECLMAGFAWIFPSGQVTVAKYVEKPIFLIP